MAATISYRERQAALEIGAAEQNVVVNNNPATSETGALEQRYPATSEMRSLEQHIRILELEVELLKKKLRVTK